MDFEIPTELRRYLDELDEFIEREIRPLEQKDDNIRFFDHRREDARTDWERDGLPNEEWEALLFAARRLADEAGHYRYALPKDTWPWNTAPSSTRICPAWISPEILLVA